MSERARLRSEAKLIGAAIMPGRLICLGDYPGLLDTAADDRVHGEVYEIDDRFGIFRWLDPYEDFEPERPGKGLIGVCSGQRNWLAAVSSHAGSMCCVLLRRMR